MSKHVIIIGAGIGGLATANLLVKAGYTVSVYEKNSQPGGRAGRLQVDGFTFDTGPSWYLMPDVFQHYFELLGDSVDDHLKLTKLQPAYKVFFESETPITITGDEQTDQQTFESIEVGSGQALKHYVDQGHKTYRLALRHFLYTNFSSIRDILKPDILRHGVAMLRLASQSIDHYVSKYVHDQRLKQILEYPTVFLGSSPFTTPAIYSLMSALDFKEGVYYPAGGLYEIITALVNIGKKLGVTYHYNSAVQSISCAQGLATGIILADGEQVMADEIVSNADLHFTETQLIPHKYQTYPQSYWTKKTAGPSALLLYLGVQGSLPDFNHHNLLFVDSWRENFEAIYKTQTIPHPASIYICNPSKIDPLTAPVGQENLFVLVPLPAGMTLDSEAQEMLADEYIDQISRMAKVPDLSNRIVSRHLFGPDDFSSQFHAWQSTALGPSHTLRQSAFFRAANKSKKLTNLFYVGGGTVPGIGLPMCLIGAELVYKRLAGDKRGGPVSAIKTIGDL